ncbi:MAG: amidohydrolase family protein [Clostridia bacterium]|nr:amidohydrolase family protein [Clostridia bacterium]
MLAITNATIVMTDHYIYDGTVLVDNGKIVDFGRKVKIPEGAEILDVNGAYVGPGLIDIHTHADGETFFNDDAEKAADTLLHHGVTDVLPALYYNMNKEQYLTAIAYLKDVMASGKAKNIIGFYMEGPYLNPKFGCNRENNPWKGPVDAANYKDIVDAAGDLAKVWCLAPERENIEEFVRYAKSVNPNAVFAVAHSEASPEEIEKIIPYGLKIATHHTNATGTLNKYPECRSACVDECALYNDSIYTELICDKVGIHVDPYMLRLIRKIKGDDKIVLIADSFVEHGPIPDGDLYEGATDINFDFMGEIAGSKMILDGPCQNIIKHTGASVCQAFKFASTNPAKVLGLSDRGRIAVGNVANLIVVDHLFNVKYTVFGGEIVK